MGIKSSPTAKRLRPEDLSKIHLPYGWNAEESHCERIDRENIPITKHTDRPMQAAAKTIEGVLTAFLAAQQDRLKPQTYQKYETIVELFQDFMNGYVYADLDGSDLELFEQLNNAEGDAQRDFCQIFGPTKIADNVDEFLHYFMVRKVMNGKSLKPTAETVIKKLEKWLKEKDWFDPEETGPVTADGAEVVPEAQELTELLIEYAGHLAADGDHEEIVEDYFVIESIEPDRLFLSDVSGEEGISVPVSPQISDALQVGWTIAGAAAKTTTGWRFVKVWNVYPHHDGRDASAS